MTATFMPINCYFQAQLPLRPVDNPVISSLLPVVLLIAIGFATGRARWISTTSVKDLSNLVFLVLTPALLFRTMSTVHVEQLDFRPVLAYFIAVILIFAATLAVGGFNPCPSSRRFCLRRRAW